MKMQTYIIAEIGINFNGSLDNCYKMIDVSVEAGCNAAKFQMFSAKNMYPRSAGKLDWKDNDKEYSYDIYEAIERFELPEEWIDSLIEYCDNKGIDFMASIFDIEGLNIMINKGMKIIKLSSYTITNLPLIEAAAKTNLPIIMSTGGATLGETEEAVNTVLKYHDNLTILHCSIQYPTELKDVNMGVLETFKLAFPNIKIGYSDHTAEISKAPVQSIYLGGSVVEKHITLDKKMEGPDHFFALEPEELKKMVKDIKQAKKDYEDNKFVIDKTIYGSSEKICHEHEQYLRDFCYMTLFSKKEFKKGELINFEDVSILRAGKKDKGLEPKYLELFKKYKIRAKKDISFEDPITWESIL
jgi:N-acetylneuraminate synthase